jgi:ubiquinone biosynthesis protein
MKALKYSSRFLVMAAVVTWFLMVYALGRARRAFIRDREARRQAVAHWKGAVMRRVFAALGACFVKLGQVLSTRPDLLEPEIIDELRQLQDRLPAFAFAEVRALIEGDLGGAWTDHLRDLDEKPVAAASVAQVHRGHLADGTEVAVKVLRPGIHDKVERDATILVALARVVAWHPTWRLSDPVEHMESFVAGILEQTNLRLELANYDLFRKNFADVTGVRFPRVYPELSGERVMTMEFLSGRKVDALPSGDHRDLARRLQTIVLKMCFEDGFFHADLHPGNVLISERDEICIFDVGLVKRLSDNALIQFIDFTKCIAMGTPQDFVAHLKRFHTYVDGVDWAALEVDVTAYIQRFRALNSAELEMGVLVNDTFALARKYKVRPVSELALIFVGLVTAEGIGKQLNPKTNLFQDTAAYLMPLLAKRGLGLAAGASQ